VRAASSLRVRPRPTRQPAPSGSARACWRSAAPRSSARTPDRHCVDTVAHDDASTIVVVRHRSARLVRDHAFVVPAPAALQVGELVDVDLQRCLLKPRTADTPSTHTAFDNAA